eukprot:jgi/Chlat1/7757/Chrsp66S07224
MAKGRRRKASPTVPEPVEVGIAAKEVLHIKGAVPSPSWVSFLTASALLPALAVGLFAAAEAFLDEWRHICAIGAAATVFLAVPVTHFIGGYWRYGPYGWAFWQPFVGGAHFVLFQALSWALYAISLLATVLALLRPGNSALQPCATAVMAEVLMVSSLLTFKTPSSRKQLQSWPMHGPFGVDSASAPVLTSATEHTVQTPAGTTVQQDGSVVLVINTRFDVAGLYGTLVECFITVRAWATIWLMYNPHFTYLGIVGASFALLPTRVSLSLFVGTKLLYALTWIGSPHITGKRTWWEGTYFWIHWLEQASTRYFKGVHLFRESSEPLDPSKRYVFGFHPHALMPATTAWFHQTEQWKRLFPGIQPVLLCASIVFHVPILRDLLMWRGARVVSRASFQLAVRDQKAVVLCPGGQAELVATTKLARDARTVVIYTGHKGFVRQALQSGAELVPVFNFGESHILFNFVAWPALQRWTYKRFGFPVPFLPVGLMNYLPLPCRIPMNIVVGEPLRMPELASQPSANLSSGNETLVYQPTEQQVEEMAKRFYTALIDLFHRHKHKFGYDDATLLVTTH